MSENTDNMMDLFGDAGITVVDTSSCKDTNDNKVRCYAMNFKEMVFQDPLDLFDGDYTDLKIITFSFDFDFASKLSNKFKDVEIIVGAEFLSSQINKDIADRAAYLFANADTVKTSVYRNQKFAKRVMDGNIKVLCPKIMYDHRKLYLLKADDGRVRTIFPSANLSGVAWNVNHHIENYMFCDDIECYDYFLEEFRTIQSLSASVILDANISESDTEFDEKKYDPSKENPIIENAKQFVDTAIVVQKVENPETKITLIKHVEDLEAFEAKHKEYLNGVGLKENKDAFVTITAKKIQKYETNAEKIRLSKVTVEEKKEAYPALDINYTDKNAFLNEEMLDLSPSDEEVKSDISELLGAFANYDRFVDDVFEAKRNHYKMLVAMFSSVFNARVRCTAKVKNIKGLSALPLYMLLNSSADSGKTFMVELGLKMMTGRDENGYKYESMDNMKNVQSKGDALAVYQLTFHGIPIFIDEVDGNFSKSFGKMIKSPQTCEENMLQDQPMVIFASNDVPAPKKELRKRMIYLTYNIRFSSKDTRREYETLGGHIIHRMGTAFYRKYLSMMIPYVAAELDKIETGVGLSDKYSPELIQRSSEIFIDIIRQYGFDVPDYMSVLTWDKDYADNSQSVSSGALKEIKEYYRSDSKMFIIEEKYVTICLDKDTGKKTCDKWATSLPNDACAKIIPSADASKIRIKRKELEEMLHLKFDTGLRAKIKNLLS